MLLNTDKADLRSLVEHDFHIGADDTVEAAYGQYARHAHEFAAVLRDGKVAGICSRERIGLLLSQQFGRSLYARRKVAEFLLLPATVVSVTAPITHVLEKAFTRPPETFFEDLLLVDESGRYLGMIPMERLVRLQHGYFVNHIGLLGRQQRELNEKNSEMQQELNIAGQLQMSLLPPAAGPSASHPTLGYAYRIAPLETVSGDFLFILDSQPRKLGILLCDVMGHGVRAALVAAMIWALIQRDARKALQPGEILARLNRDLACLLRGEDMIIFVTACCVTADEETRQVHFACAGHHIPCRVRADAAAQFLQTDRPAEPAIGLFENTAYTTCSFPLAAGDRFLVFTDGLFEARRHDGEEFGTHRLLEQIEAHKIKPINGMLDGIVAGVRQFMAPQSFGDDACIAALAYEKGPG